MAAALSLIKLAAPIVPVVSNVNVTPTQDPTDIARLLVEQVTGRVRWRETIMWFASQGATHFVEIGAASVLTGMSRRIAPDAISLSLSCRADLEAFAALLSQ